MEKTTRELTEKDKKVISLVAKLTDREIFGLECYLAGTRASQPITKQESQGTATA